MYESYSEGVYYYYYLFNLANIWLPLILHNLFIVFIYEQLSPFSSIQIVPSGQVKRTPCFLRVLRYHFS